MVIKCKPVGNKHKPYHSCTACFSPWFFCKGEMNSYESNLQTLYKHEESVFWFMTCESAG